MPDPVPTSTQVIPHEQQPLTQYQELRRSFFSGWPAQSLGIYLKGFAKVWIPLFLLTAPIAAGSFSWRQDPGHWLATTILAANGLVSLVIVRLYLGWQYVQDRLRQEQVAYEESGWYDIAIAAKTPEELTQHRLIVQVEIAPIMQRIRRTLGWLVLTCVMLGLTWQWL